MVKKAKSFWDSTKTYTIKFLKGKFITLALKKILGTAVGGGIKVWLVKFIATKLYNEIGEPLIHFIFNESEYTYHKVQGKIIIKKLGKAREEENSENYDAAVDGAFH